MRVYQVKPGSTFMYRGVQYTKFSLMSAEDADG
jgi:hypothetical protein